jgi:hypothetical protein
MDGIDAEINKGDPVRAARVKLVVDINHKVSMWSRMCQPK